MYASFSLFVCFGIYFVDCMRFMIKFMFLNEERENET